MGQTERKESNGRNSRLMTMDAPPPSVPEIPLFLVQIAAQAPNRQGIFPRMVTLETAASVQCRRRSLPKTE